MVGVKWLDTAANRQKRLHPNIWLMWLPLGTGFCPGSADSVQLELRLSCSLWGPRLPPLTRDPKLCLALMARGEFGVQDHRS